MNYIDFYRLKEQPFSTSIDNRFYYNSQQHGQALLKMKYAIEQRKGLAIVVGHVGAGKTTLARQLLEDLHEDEYESALLVVIHKEISALWILRKIAIQLGVEQPELEKVNLLTQLYKRLLDIYDAGKKAVVLVDEAQMLNQRDIMEEFRGLLNIEIDANKLITFIFFGLSELDETLALDEPLQQRVAIRHELHSLEAETTEAYIRYRLHIAGTEERLFSPEALKVIHACAKGFPRLINTLCDNALLEGFLLKRDRVDAGIVEEVAKDLKLFQPQLMTSTQ